MVGTFAPRGSSTCRPTIRHPSTRRAPVALRLASARPARAALPAITLATPEVRARCVLGHASQYDADQIAYHYDRDATLARFRREAGITTPRG